MSDIRHIGLLGLGEVGSILAADLAPAALAAYDVAFADAGSAPARTLAARPALPAAGNAAELARGADLVICAVTAAQDLPAAQSAAAGLAGGTWFLDVNSVSPGTRRQVAQVVEAAGGRYVEAAVMAPFAPRRLGSPILLGGPHAASFLPLAASLGFSAMRVLSPEVGRAAAVKMCRSVVVKGLEALVSESLLTARRYGVVDEILDTLESVLPRGDWPDHARYLISRTLEHGTRRAEEMREAAVTVREAGVEPWMSEACVARQAWAAGRAGGNEQPLRELLDDVLRSLDATPAAVADTTRSGT